MKLFNAVSIIIGAVLSGGKHTETLQVIRQSSQIKASAAACAKNAAADLEIFEEAARHMRGVL